MGGDNLYSNYSHCVSVMRAQFFFHFFFHKIIDRRITIMEKSIVVTSCNSFISSWAFLLFILLLLLLFYR
jgi:hypothetical protein